MNKRPEMTLWLRFRVWLGSKLMGDAWRYLCEVGWCPMGIHERKEALAWHDFKVEAMRKERGK